MSDPKLSASPGAEEPTAAAPDSTVASLKEAVGFIERNPTLAAPSLAVPAPKASPPPSTKPAPSSRLEAIAEQILLELRRRNEQIITDFSVSKLLAGIVQVLVLATLFLGYLQARSHLPSLQIYLLVAVTLQTMTIALLIMSRQK